MSGPKTGTADFGAFFKIRKVITCGLVAHGNGVSDLSPEFSRQ